MDEQEKFLSANHKRLLRIATWAKYLAWIVLIGYFLYAAALYVEKQNIYLHYGGVLPPETYIKFLISIPSFGLSVLIQLIGVLLQGVVYYFVLKGVSLGLNMLVETDINYREAKNERDLKRSEPTHEPNEESNDANYEFSKEELEIIDDENPPDFYDPFEVLWLTKRFDWLIKIMIAFTILYNVLNYPTSTSIVQYFNLERSNSIWAYIIAFAVTIASTIISIILMYIPLKALSHILRILMKMEFRSRKAN